MLFRTTEDWRASDNLIEIHIVIFNYIFLLLYSRPIFYIDLDPKKPVSLDL